MIGNSRSDDALSRALELMGRRIIGANWDITMYSAQGCRLYRKTDEFWEFAENVKKCM
jgi:hypothetical protein